MRPPRNPNPLPPEPSATPNVRRHGRLRCNMLECELGEVIDLSASGMRVAIAKKKKLDLEEGSLSNVTVTGLGAEIPLRVRIVWVKKTGMKSYELGMEFENLSPSEKTAITSLARSAAQSETIWKGR